jgi:hypothetical protein
MNSLSDPYLQCWPRHSGIGSLPSATTTVCTPRLAASPDREWIVKIALYNPARAKAVSRISSSLFIWGSLLAHTSARGEVYAESMLRAQAGLWIIVVSGWHGAERTVGAEASRRTHRCPTPAFSRGQTPSAAPSLSTGSSLPESHQRSRPSSQISAQATSLSQGGEDVRKVQRPAI